jgi:PEGA domain-containing protein
LAAGTTPYKTDYPGGYFHKTHTVFGSRLEHSMTLRISMDGYLPQQVTLTQGPFEWVAVTGRHRGNYFLLRSNHFNIKLEPISFGSGGPIETIGHDGPLRPASAAAFRAEDRHADTQLANVKIDSDPPGAEIYVDGSFMGQTPSTLRLTSGAHRVELKAPGRKEWQRDLEVLKDSQLTLHPVLEQSP